MTNNSVDIVRYLVVEKGMALSDEKDLPLDILAQNFELILRLLPSESDVLRSNSETYTTTQSSNLPYYNNSNGRTTSYSSEIGAESITNTDGDETDLVGIKDSVYFAILVRS